MKIFSSILMFLFLPFFLKAQLVEDFSDGDFSHFPKWYGDTAFFEVRKGRLNSDFIAQSGFPQVNFSLSTRSESVNKTVWEFWVKTKTTSKNNFIRIFLTSQKKIPRRDTADYGYFVEIGNTPDEVAFYKKDSLSIKKLIQGRTGITERAELKIKVICTADYEWQLYTDISGSGNQYLLDGKITDSTIKKSKYFSIEIFQKGKTANKSQWFDNISIRPFIPDMRPPILTQIIVKDSHRLYLSFSEALLKEGLKSELFQVDNHKPDSVYFLHGNPAILSLYFQNSFQQKENHPIQIKGVSDLSGNKLDTTADFIYYQPQKWDVVMSEIYPDPKNSNGLPEEEFLELYNRSEYPISLSDWKICDKVRCATFPPIILVKKETLLVCGEKNEQYFKTYGDVIGLVRFPSLNNGEEKLYLKNEQDEIIHQVHYTKKSYHNKDKSKGGWTLEMQHPKYPCLAEGNWAASTASIGGTPGIIKKVVNLPTLEIDFLKVIDSIHLDLKVNTLLSKDNIDKAIFNLNHQHLQHIKIDSTQENLLHFRLNRPLKKSRKYTFSIIRLHSCGLAIEKGTTISFLLPEKAQKGDIFINELLFNPKKRGGEYIELYNASDKIIDLQQLYLANIRHGDIYQKYPAATHPYYFQPKQYVAITKDKESVLLQYLPKFPKRIIEVSRLPSYPNTSGNALLLNHAGETLDSFSYIENNQSTFIHNKKGVALEKIYPTYPSEKIKNWHSAASIYYFGTPGYHNSQFKSENSPSSHFKLTPKVFSPDGDGRNDFVYLHYTLSPGYAAKIIVFNEYGIPVKHLGSNISLGTKNKIPWDGKDDKGHVLPTGIYIFFINAYHPSGKTLSKKLPVVLVKRY